MIELTLKNTRIKLSPLFFAVLTVFLLYNRDGNAFIVICFSAMHELCHFAALAMLKSHPTEVTVSFVGISMRLSHGMSTIQKIFVFSAGAIGNFVLATFFATAGNIKLCAVNVIIGVFTIMPLCSTDGGSIVKELVEYFYPERAKILCSKIFLFFCLTEILLFVAAMIFLKNPYFLIPLFYAVICWLKY